MNITESRLPQDGAIKRQFGKLYLDMRASSLPTNEGEKIVIRILDYSRSLQGLEHLGFSHTNFEKLKRMIQIPNGIILVTGATGTGKSTTTYSILQALNKPETNIITVEDPIEMNIEGINQVQVNSEIGLDFATVLRSILRQDPNIILIGEIRDSETAKIAVRASITGHLVLSTIHTNNSLSTIERLLDMDVERYLLSSALTGIISQRLAKMLCPKCKIEREATPYEKKIFKNVLKEDIEKLYDANHDGCDYCHNGYKGRIAVQEVLEIDDEIRDALNDEKLEKEDLREMVYTSNVITLLQDGLEKVLEGITSFEEIYRIIEIDSDITENYGAELTEANKERLKQEKQNKIKEEINSEVTDSAKSINSDDKTSSVDDTATISTNSQNVESIINKNEKNEEKSNIIITPPMIPAYTDQVNYSNPSNPEQISDTNSSTINIPNVQNNFYNTNNSETNQDLNSTDKNINSNNESEKINFSPLNTNETSASGPTLSLLTEVPQNYNQIDNSNQVNLQPTISTINDVASPTLIENQANSEPTLIENN